MAEQSPPSWASYAHINWQSRYQRLNDDTTADIAEYPRAFDYEQPQETLTDERLRPKHRTSAASIASLSKPLPPVPQFDPPQYVAAQDSKYIPLRDLSMSKHSTDDTTLQEIDLEDTGRSRRDGQRGWRRKCVAWWSWNFQGWRAGVLSAAMSSTVVLLINLITTIWATSANKVDPDHRVVIFEGECARMRPLNTWIHLLINLLSTVLLSASNYSMQCLSAPTRDEVDWAHARSIWLDIGIPSFRNLRYIKRSRVYVWLILGASSLPLHLFYNSAVFASISANTYHAFTVSPDFVSGTGSLDEALDPANVSTSVWERLQWGFDALRGSSPDLEEITDVQRCIDLYAVNFVSDRSDLFMVAKTPNNSYNSLLLARTPVAVNLLNGDPIRWMCEQDGETRLGTQSRAPACSSSIGGIKTNSSGWQPEVFSLGDYMVDKCYSRRVPERCKVEFALDLAITVIVLNALKAAAMFWLAIYIKDSPLMTMGDAVASFLRRPCGYTLNMCLVSKSMIKAYPYGRRWGAITVQYRLLARRWFVAASVKRWITTMGMYTALLIIVMILLNIGINGLTGPNDAKAIGGLGLGQITPLAIISWELPKTGASGLAANVLMANLAQPILSFLYFTYNGLFTCMFLAKEWAGFATVRKGLRVSTVPVGEQRSTYFLQLPYRYALPLMALSGLLHWLVSQSIFLVSVQDYDFSGGAIQLSDSVMSCGYSPLAIIFVLTLGLLMVVAALAMGWLRFKPGMPVAGSCSAAMAAACHSGEKGSEVKRVMWGVTRHGDTNRPGHCAFSSQQVESPVEWNFYAGDADLKVDVQGT